MKYLLIGAALNTICALGVIIASIMSAEPPKTWVLIAWCAIAIGWAWVAYTSSRDK